jgi:hypothetical protein
LCIGLKYFISFLTLIYFNRKFNNFEFQTLTEAVRYSVVVKEYTPFKFISEWVDQIPMFCPEPFSPKDYPTATVVSVTAPVAPVVAAPVSASASDRSQPTLYRRPDGEAVSIILSPTATPTATPSKRARSTPLSLPSSLGSSG